MKRTIITLILSLVILTGYANDSIYLPQDQHPHGGLFLPPPPDVTSPLFANDLLFFQHGKSLRSTPRGQQASIESDWRAPMLISIVSQALDLPITEQSTPAIYRLLYRATIAGAQSTRLPKKQYMRMRPFARLNEHVASAYDDESYLRTNGSYPSGHTSMGWLTALVATEIAPEYLDTILRRGFQYGENRWIVGAHWRSDVEAGYLCASASWARLHTMPAYCSDLTAARAEYRALRPLSGDSVRDGLLDDSLHLVLPNGRRIVDTPVDTACFRFTGDLMASYQAMYASSEQQREQAIAGAADKTKDLIRYLVPANRLKSVRSRKVAPELYALMTYTRQAIQTTTRTMKHEHFRKRPFVQLGIHTLIPDEEDSHRLSSSYPSSHAAIGWGMALVLVELMPEDQNDILRAGYEYGYNRVVAAYHYASDVQTGRLIATSVIARLHSDPTFLALLSAARRNM